MPEPLRESWRPVVGYERTYEVSDCGQVRSWQRRGRQEAGRDDLAEHSEPLVLCRHRAGYAKVTLHTSGRRATRLVHQLVLEAFVGPRPSGQEVRHLNGDPWDNQLANLVWGTPSENMFDCVRHGTHPQSIKTHCKQGHPYDEVNTKPRGHGKGRRCRICANLATSRWGDTRPPRIRALKGSS